MQRVRGVRAALLLWLMAGTPVSADPPAIGAQNSESAIAAGEPAQPHPPGMVWIPAGDFEMGGVGPEARPDEFPLHRVRLDGFWMDETEVTNAQYRAFVEATGFVTEAEKAPDWEELKKQLAPGTPKPNDSVLVPGAMVFMPTQGPVSFDDSAQWWAWVPGASWRNPLGPQSSLGPEYEAYPVVHVSWNDAVSYCAWAGKRLPTEAEWEWAARGGIEPAPYAWGAELLPSGKHRANLWQGAFPYERNPVDGFLLAAPVKTFPPNGYGLYDTIGNVWEWCGDWFREDYYAALAASGVAANPQGPKDSLDPAEPYTPKRVNRGGSFLCNAEYCASYRPAARMKTSPDTGQIHLGFRAVMSDDAWRERVTKTERRPENANE